MKKKGLIISVVPVCLLALICIGCATKIAVEVQKTPTINTAGINRIAVLPFTYTSGNFSDYAGYVTSQIRVKFQDPRLSRFQMVDAQRVQESKDKESLVEAMLKGEVTRVASRDTQRSGSYKASDGTIVNYTDYFREVEIDFNYSIVKASDGSVIGVIQKHGRRTDSSRNDASRLRSVSALAQSAVDWELTLFYRDVAPYTVTEKLALAQKDSTLKNKELDQKLKNTYNMVKGGSYKQALDAYLGLYKEYTSVAAAINASYLHEAVNSAQDAVDYLRGVYNDTGNPNVNKAIARLNKILQDAGMIASEYDDARSLSEKVSDYATGQAKKVLSAGAKVWIVSETDSVLGQAVVDNLVSYFVRDGIGVVDRENTALIEAEQGFQMSGNVSDDDIMRVGNAAGATDIVRVNVIGEAAQRRLQLRITSIEKRTLIFTSDTSDSWKL